MRPKSIARFEALSLLSVALAALSAFLTWGGSIPGSEARAAGGSAAMAAAALGIVISLVLIFFTSRKRSNVAKWILVVLVVVSVVMAVPRLGEIAAAGLVRLPDAASIILQAVAIFFLFTAEARAWFAGGGSGADADAGVRTDA
jgi:hypothetical protein